MAKKTTAKQVVANLKAGVKHDHVVLAVPSHDRRNNPITTQEFWVEEAMKVISGLYGGGTAFQAYAGVYRSETGEDLWDRPVLVESYAEREDVEDESKLVRLLQFVRRMREQTDQECVLLVVNEYRYFIK